MSKHLLVFTGRSAQHAPEGFEPSDLVDGRPAMMVSPEEGEVAIDANPEAFAWAEPLPEGVRILLALNEALGRLRHLSDTTGEVGALVAKLTGKVDRLDDKVDALKATKPPAEAKPPKPPAEAKADASTKAEA